MIRKTPQNKGIQEEMTNQELALMMTNSFKAVFDEFRAIHVKLLDLEKRVGNLEENMVTKYEFKSLAFRIDKMEQTISL